MSPLDRFGDIVFFNVKGSPGTVVDLDQILRKPDKQPLVFASGDAPLRLMAYPGAPIRLDFSASSHGGDMTITYRSLDKPQGSVLDPKTGAFSWNPTKIEDCVFVVEATLDRWHALQARAMETLKSASDAEFFATLIQLEEAIEGLKPLTPLLPDGSMDFPSAVASSNIGEAMSLLVDGNNDTFPGFYLAKDNYYEFDFGTDFKFSATAFAMEGRVNFEDRMEGVKIYGSNDGKTWTELTPEATRRATELTKIKVADNLADSTFRFLRVWKHGGGVFEASEMRIFGSRHETGNK